MFLEPTTAYDFSAPLTGSQLVALAGLVYLLAVAPRLAWIDASTRRLPNRIVVPGIGVALVGELAATALDPRLSPRLATALACATTGFVLTLLAHLRFGLGMGDVKLYVLIALVLGWLNPLLVPVVWLLASVSGVLELAVRAVAKRTLRLTGTIALGPHLLAASATLCVLHFSGVAPLAS